jgi:hypothetical protein
MHWWHTILSTIDYVVVIYVIVNIDYTVFRIELIESILLCLLASATSTGNFAKSISQISLLLHRLTCIHLCHTMNFWLLHFCKVFLLSKFCFIIFLCIIYVFLITSHIHQIVYMWLSIISIQLFIIFCNYVATCFDQMVI